MLAEERPPSIRRVPRETVIDLAADLGITTEERPFTLFDVWTAREAFMCGTMAEIVPVASIDGRAIENGTAGARCPLGAMTSRIAAASERFVRSTGTPINRVTGAIWEAAG